MPTSTPSPLVMLTSEVSFEPLDWVNGMRIPIDYWNVNQYYPNPIVPFLRTVLTMIDNDSLRCFDATATSLNFRIAAERLAVSPSVVSFRIRQLEEQIAAQLFERSTRRVKLTPARAAPSSSRSKTP